MLSNMKLYRIPPGDCTKYLPIFSIRFTEKMLEYYKNNQKDQLEPVEFLQWKEKINAPFVNENIGKYRRMCGPSAALELLVLPIMNSALSIIYDHPFFYTII